MNTKNDNCICLLRYVVCVMLFLTLPSCFDIRNDFGITAKTSNNFTKDDAEKYNYAFDASKITYKDKITR